MKKIHKKKISDPHKQIDVIQSNIIFNNFIAVYFLSFSFSYFLFILCIIHVLGNVNINDFSHSLYSREVI
jgi:hypothetical protein